MIPWPEFRLQLLRASFKVWRPLTCIEHRPEFRKALDVSPIAVTVSVESSFEPTVIKLLGQWESTKQGSANTVDLQSNN